MPFTICYSLQGKRVVIELDANRLSPHDAVYYSLIHSGADFRSDGSEWTGSYLSIASIAERYGITDVRWHQSVAHPHL
jgi:hypothetical protein